MRRRHLCHLVYRFDVGGLESVLVELMQRLPAERYRHSLVALTEVGVLQQRLQGYGVAFYALHKQPGKDLAVWWRLYRLLRQLRPDLLHSCNLATIEGQLPAFLAGVPRRIHAEHGRDSYDLDGSNRKYRWLRRLLNPLIHHWVAVSGELHDWLAGPLKIQPAKIVTIANGVDLERFHPARADRAQLLAKSGFADEQVIALCVGRLWPVKDQANLLTALALLQQQGRLGGLRLVLVGDGPQRGALEQQVSASGLATVVRFLGTQFDVAPLMAAADLLVLPSLAEGTPLTVLEAMACGVPVVATAVGGVPALLQAGQQGALLPPGDAPALAEALQPYGVVSAKAWRRAQGAQGRARAEAQFGWARTVAAYEGLFQ
ncbi:glycosyl transferase, group 1 [Magnetococcus marinus MC-1]|uniref:Glycosyl transferase, group 1 n=1 Tax=Magnetococcus marinus (strain ATCC BAA-1437 / JCM 17883 / MC-1) TaxID=156889 RepID=A0L569_MAGMM|nr:TIGR03088 family PEP-CTERM/XrtA system glycosyltransferase [Magnetococcus marinus]ABK43112.1 glycosyl transferase, group 1 [Magnetococcus marinus MC-1]